MPEEVKPFSETEITDKRRFVGMTGLLLESERRRQQYDARWLATLDALIAEGDSAVSGSKKETHNARR